MSDSQPPFRVPGPPGRPPWSPTPPVSPPPAWLPPSNNQPGAGWPGWLQAGLFEQRTVFLRGTLDDTAAAHAAAELMTHDGAGDEPISLIVDSAGGTLEATFALIDTIDLVGVPVTCTCLGRAHGPALAVAAVCTKRRAAPHTQFRLALPETTAGGTARDLEQWRIHHDQQLERLSHRLADATGQPVEHVERDLHTGRYFSSEEAKAYGLIDEVLDRSPVIRSLPNLPGNGHFGFHPR